MQNSQWHLLQTTAEELGIPLSEAEIEQYRRYATLLLEANQRINLTAFKTLAAVVDKIILDSLTILPVVAQHLGYDMCALRNTALHGIDIGTGAGVPGIPLLLAWPNLHLTLVESVGKKARFLEEAVSSLRIPAEVFHGRAEMLARVPAYRQAFDLAMARAVAPLATLVELVLPFLKIGGIAALPKGPRVFSEAEEAHYALSALGGELAAIESTPLKNTPEQRYIVLLRKVDATPETYPRSPGIPQKRPLSAPQ
ncbi:MAG: 16S rRNA (guanine(527)-N(7))-methyltransferase RsmG [Chloroflexi bacterium]|nr:MAG: 16S rRNA (guanine(527)-N(7))-methyltransferase RsmG [Chloroflexota bacterium]